MSGGGETQTTQSGPPEWAAPYFQNNIARAGQIADLPYQNYGQSRVADFTAPQQMGFDLTAQRALQGSPLNRQAQNSLSGQLAGTSNPYFQQGGQGNPYLQGMINRSQDSLTRGFNNATQNTDAQFARAGAFGGSAWGQQQENNSRVLADQLGGLENQFRYQDYGMQSQLGENAANRSLQAAGMAPGLAQSDYYDINQLSGIGDRMQQQNQGLLSDAYGRFQEAQNWPMRGQNVMNDALARITGGTSTQTGGGSDGSAQAIGTAIMLASVFSDRRLKTDIKRVGKTDSGLPIYTYKMIGSEKTQMGVMADEAKKLYPDAVSTHASGFDMVNYEALK